MQQLPFHKLSGAGNDFIVLDERDLDVDGAVDPGWLAARLCRRALSLGADGLILLGRDPAGVRVRFYNPDGSRAEACGNGSRCAARDALERGFVAGSRFQLLTDSGDLAVEARPDGTFAVAMPQPTEPQLALLHVEILGQSLPVHALRVGVPHAVIVAPDVERLSDDELCRLGRRLRHDPAFPDGTNVNVVTRLPDDSLRQRTYERGVEAITKACGTGATASATVAQAVLGLGWPVRLRVDGGELRVEQRAGRPWLSGDARLVARGTLEPEAVSWAGCDPAEARWSD